MDILNILCSNIPFNSAQGCFKMIIVLSDVPICMYLTSCNTRESEY